MKRIKVESSSIESLGYDFDTRTLEIEFKRGAIYQYKNVESDILIKLIFAESIGKYFAQYIKNSYEYSEVK
jgi:hypothetical protein